MVVANEKVRKEVQMAVEDAGGQTQFAKKKRSRKRHDLCKILCNIIKFYAESTGSSHVHGTNESNLNSLIQS